MEKINANDEAAFTFMSEQFVLELTKTFRRVQPELMHCPLIEMCLHIENAVFQKALEENAMPLTAYVWTSGQAIMYYQELRGKVLKNLEYKSNVNWRKLYDENRSNPQRLIQELLKDETLDRKTASSAVSKGIPRIKGVKKAKVAKDPNNNMKSKFDKKSKGQVTFKDTSSSVIMTNPLPITSSTSLSNLPMIDININNFPDSLLDDGNFDLGFDMNEDSLLPVSVAWKVHDDTNAIASNNMASSSSSSQADGSSIWKAAQTSQRQKQDESYRLQQQEMKMKEQHHQQQQQYNITSSSSSAMDEVASRERGQREMQEKLQYEREMERKRRDDEAKQLQDAMDIDDMMDGDWLDN